MGAKGSIAICTIAVVLALVLLLIVDMPRRTGLSSIWMHSLGPWVCVLLAFLFSVIVRPGDRLSQLLVVAHGLRRTHHALVSWGPANYNRYDDEHRVLTDVANYPLR